MAIVIAFDLWKCPKSDRKTNLVSCSIYIVLLRHVDSSLPPMEVFEVLTFFVHSTLECK